MAYCISCGRKLLDSNPNFCSHCGASLEKQKITAPIKRQYEPKRKHVRLAVVLSILIVGGGQFYVGRILRGFGFLGLAFLLSFVINTWLLFGPLRGTGMISLSFLIGLLIGGGMSLLSAFDVYELVKQYNYHIDTHGEPPW